MIKNIDQKHCGPVPCCGSDYTSDTVDISNISNVSLEGKAPNCSACIFCCAGTKEHITVTVTDGAPRVLVIGKKEGEKVVNKINTQVEVMQHMEQS